MENNEELEVKIEEIREEKVIVHVIYCGPTLPNEHGLKQYQTFIGGAPEHITETIKECPAIEQMMVPVAELARVRIAMGNPVSLESFLYKKITEHFAK